MSMRNRIKKSVAAADSKNAAREMQLLLDTRFDVESLSFVIKEHEKYQALMDVIQTASERNLSVAELESNIHQLGEEAWELTQDIIKAVS
ncbi:hypothetical protein [Vibrio crassostreae]|uniref:hypothetical protein n=1 Tax=Vibrio crassostreae TaxID=246167 RepID=UPI000F476DD7|nr:hypothetical protein [Vibrio crassostreae]ROO57896.1 hypothetical protein EDB56_1011044 [Vibrio crassostreae]ROO76833.1 hypothetical protein EDB53_0661 [Vibrio crassostreae]ROR75596.1 hypothetical protein EDB54_1108 [Vibrio crassostreae]TCN99363.1 hypothetical protein EDB50_1011149 [Vibrio crassostreae]CAK3388429.1 conserved hypothetical protein [Vibrio crassostreae]